MRPRVMHKSSMTFNRWCLNYLVADDIVRYVEDCTQAGQMQSMRKYTHKPIDINYWECIVGLGEGRKQRF